MPYWDSKLRRDKRSSSLRRVVRLEGMDRLTDFTTFSFTHAGCERTVYRKGKGPAVIVMHEVPGISAEVTRFAREVADAGFTVFMPRLCRRSLE